MSETEKKVQIVIIEGVHGIGKTTAVELFREGAPYVHILEEQIGGDGAEEPDPQGFKAEKAWAETWVARVARHLETYGRDDPVVCDRGPLSSAFYCTDRDRADELMAYVRQLLLEFQQAHHAVIHMWCLWNKKEAVWGRITARVVREPWRLRFREGDRGHFDALWARYSAYEGFDERFDNRAELLKRLGEFCT